MIRATLPALFRPALLLAASFVFACNAHADDPRLIEQFYDPGQVVHIEGRTKVQATIVFGADENIENVAVGNSEAWQITPNKRANLLFIKPLSPTARTNMTVVTDRHTYLFDLVASPRAQPLYVLRFIYPDEPEAEPMLVENPNALELAAAGDPYAVIDPAQLNFEWARTGVAGLLPERAYDDGSATFLSWPADAAIPAILTKDSAGTEGPVNFTVRGDTIVVDGVPREIVLRSGDDSAMLTYQGVARVTAIDPDTAVARPTISIGRNQK